MYVSINLELLRRLVGYAESRAEDLAEQAATASKVALTNEDRPSLVDEAIAAADAANKARRAVEMGRRIVEGR